MNWRRKFLDRISLGARDECWPWRGGRSDRGYGYMNQGGRGSKMRPATHWALLYFRGEDVPKGQVVCHTCDNPACINPDHVFVGTVSENAIDMVKKGRAPRAKLRPAEVVGIREAKARGMSNSRVARLYAVDRSTVSVVNSRRTWGYVA
jgi:hypothetical protein